MALAATANNLVHVQQLLAAAASAPATPSPRPLPDYLAAMVRRAPPADAPVVAGSTPVVAFGDPTLAEVATLGINPSKAEFVDASGPLTGSNRRLATLESLDAQDLSTLTDEQVWQVLHDCAAYFTVNPYRKYFGPLDKLLSDSLGVSYYHGTACHLDLVQWATDPIWGQLPGKALRQMLLDDGVPHLRAQLRHDNLRLVLLNGSTVLDQVEALGLATLTPIGKLHVGGTSCTLYAGRAHPEGVRFLGWSTNLPGYVSKAFKSALAQWIAQHAAELETVDPDMDSNTNPATAAQLDLDEHGYLPKGTAAHGRAQLAELFTAWLNSSNAPTIGDFGTFGRTAWVHIQLGEHTAVLNGDTKRHAIAEFLDDTQRRGTSAPWHVIANQNGVVNKVVFRDDGETTPGWYCYLTRPLASPTQLR